MPEAAPPSPPPSAAPAPLRISFILPVLNETFSLRQTVDTLFRVAAAHVHEVLIVIAPRTTPASRAVIAELCRERGALVRVHTQSLPFLGGAMQEAFALATGDYLMLMSSDLETDPERIPAFIETMQGGCWDIVAASRWISGGGFRGYDRRKLILNYLFQQTFRLIYWTRLTDLTFAYRLYRRHILTGIHWQELKHPFLLECLVKPLRCGARVTEIACTWAARPEGESANTLAETFRYLRIALRARLLPRGRIRQ
jgi:glycosyltransferase involved in cell wall biosynthesis